MSSEKLYIGKLALPKMPLILAPMENVSDCAFRAICHSFGADLVFTEFISAPALLIKEDQAVGKLCNLGTDRPIGVQVFGGDEADIEQVSEIIGQHDADLLDINFGCPAKKIVNKGAGAAVLKDIDLMVRLSASAVRKSSLPVTVKTRLGWDEKSKNIEQVVERLQDVGVSAVTIHARTREQQYSGVADWSLIGKIKTNPRIKIPIFGNGDIDSPLKANENIKKYGVDGLMIGRAAIGRPWIFRQIKYFFDTGNLASEPSLSEKTRVCVAHLNESIKWKGEKVGILEMRCHYKNYLSSSPLFEEVKSDLLRSLDAEQIKYLIMRCEI